MCCFPLFLQEIYLKIIITLNKFSASKQLPLFWNFKNRTCSTFSLLDLDSALCTWMHKVDPWGSGQGSEDTVSTFPQLEEHNDRRHLQHREWTPGSPPIPSSHKPIAAAAAATTASPMPWVYWPIEVVEWWIPADDWCTNLPKVQWDFESLRLLKGELQDKARG